MGSNPTLSVEPQRRLSRCGSVVSGVKLPTVPKLCQGIPPQQDERYGAAPLVPLLRLSWPCGATAEFYPTACTAATTLAATNAMPTASTTSACNACIKKQDCRRVAESPAAASWCRGARCPLRHSRTRTLEHGFCPPRGTHGRRVVGIHPSGEADVACVRREPRRHVPRGMSERELV